jgi:TonB family protein
LSDADAAALEATLQANPDDLDTRMELLVYFAHEGNDQLFTAQLLWFIEHHPDIATLQMAQGMFRYNVQLSEGSAEKIRTAWEQAVGKLPGSSVVLVNAASFLEQTDPERGLQLLREAQILDATVPDQHEREIAAIYAAAEVEALQPEARFNNIRMSHEAAVRLRAQLKNSADPALLVMTGRILVEMNDPRHLSEEQNSRGLALIRQAITLDPANSKWTEALDAAQAEPQRRVAFERLNSEPPRRGLVRIGSAVAEASLIAKVDPIYPPLALTARIQGSVEFTVTVGADGKVENLELVRGHPLLVNAAKDAVLKWVYRAAMQDGKAIPFVTQAIVPFRLAE